MRAVTLSLFRFESVRDRVWAFGQMGFAHFAMRGLPGLGFYKLFGSGTGEGFTPKPNFGVYAILAGWASHECAHQALANEAVFRRYRAHATESWSLHMTPRRSWGKWARQAPFTVAETAAEGPIAVLTRATIKSSKTLKFWNHAPGVSEQIGANSDVLFKQGFGEVPLINQVTFSIWPDLDAMRSFAYGEGKHNSAICAVRSGGFFSEELYARFAIEKSVGQWSGAPPLDLNHRELAA